MLWHEFVFSEKPSYRLLRHSVFWLTWWIYFSACQFLYQQPNLSGQATYVTVGSYILLKTFLLVLIYAIECYAFIYFLLPQLSKGKWLKAVVNILVLSAFLLASAYFIFWKVFPFVDSLFGPYKPNRFVTRFWPAVNLGLITPLKVMAAAGIIKYIKYWWLKKKESERLEKEKINAELQLLKAQIHPAFLFTSLNNIHDYSLSGSARAPEMLLKLSDLLSYMLYECDEPQVPLEKEIAMMKDYIELEKIKLNDAVEVGITVRSDVRGKLIAPFLLLPFIENSFKQSRGLAEQAWINMDISIDDNAFMMKLANGVSEHTPMEDVLTNVQKRLNLIYPQKHELKISSEPEMMIAVLKIYLDDETAVPANEGDGRQSFNEHLTHQSSLYA